MTANQKHRLRSDRKLNKHRGALAGENGEHVLHHHDKMLTNSARCFMDPAVSPVRNLLQVHLFVAVEQLGDVVTDDPDEEGDEDDGQDHP